MDQNTITDGHCIRENVAMNSKQSARQCTIKIFTIGFTQKTAEEFCKLLMDVGYAAGIGYEHRPDLAPTRDILNAWRNKENIWKQYADRAAIEIVHF